MSGQSQCQAEKNYLKELKSNSVFLRGKRVLASSHIIIEKQSYGVTDHKRQGRAGENGITFQLVWVTLSCRTSPKEFLAGA